MTVTPDMGRWKYLVAQGISLDANRNWFLGDAALEICPMSEDGVNNGRNDLLTRYANEVGISIYSLRAYRQVSAAWEANTRVAASWTVHRELMGNKDLIREGMTVTEATAALGRSTLGRTGPNSPRDQRVSQGVSLLNDPDVGPDMLAEFVATAIGRQIVASLLDGIEHAETPARESRSKDPISAVDLATKASVVSASLVKMLSDSDSVNSLSIEGRAMIRGLIERVSAAMVLVQTLLDGGVSDAELSEFLSGAT